jgi:NAD(P)H-dependent nitrite reductase small subunit
MATFVKACAAAEVAVGTGRLVTIGDTEVAVFNVGGTFHAVGNECPHRGGPLAEGELDGCLVQCPWHAWQFDLTTGEIVTDDLTVERYEVRVEDGAVLVAV